MVIPNDKDYKDNVKSNDASFYQNKVFDMKFLITVIIGLIPVLGYCQSLPTGNSEISVRIMTTEEIQRIDKHANIMKITMKYAPELKIQKETTIKDYYDLLVSMGNKNPLKQFSLNLTEAYRLISENEPTKRIKTPTEIQIFPCASCGCGATDRPGYIISVGSTYWCACCPK